MKLYPAGTTERSAVCRNRPPDEIIIRNTRRLKERFVEFGHTERGFFVELIRTRRRGKNDAARVLGLLAAYHRDDLARAPEAVVSYRAYSWSAVERILAAQARPGSVWESCPNEPY